MHPIQQRLFVCGFDEREQYQSQGISHIVTITNPGANVTRPSWFNGAYLDLRFGDVTSEVDAARCNTTAPSKSHIEQALSFFRQAWTQNNSKILVSCDYGASRSPALAYIFAADVLGPGREAEALNLILEVRPVAMPNTLVVRIGGVPLKRQAALQKPLRDFYAKINAELFEKRS